MLSELGKKALIVDDYSEMEICSPENKCSVPDSFSYFSTIAVDGTAKGVTIANAKYPLADGTINSSYQYGISNEVIPSETAHITVKEGKLLIIKIR